ncbi:MAG: hypothetical protein C4334_12010 [Pyrinomonas sp.]|uniref:tetratricopeptide repeat protein n=1 Tax=Pyrinomonas sp. TaxID=2080306 RepID=UPI0033275D2F
MTYSSFFAILLALLLFASSTLAQQKGRKRAVAAPQSEPQATREQETERPASKSEERAAAASRTEDLAPLLSLPLEERIRRLHEIVERSDSASSALVREARTQLMRAYIERGRALLAANATEGVAALERAIDVAPEEIADEIFLETIAQIPPLLFARAQQTKALQAARRIETKFNASPAKLLTVAAFHLSVESADDAARVAERAIEIAPTLSAGYQALGAARRLQLRLDDAVAAYRRAVELEKSRNAKRSLADLLRAIGKPEEALPLYRELIAENSRDTAARAGSVLSLFEMGKRDQAEREMEAALGEETRNLALLAGAAYWYAANGEAARAVEFARRAIEIEPRYTWAQIALARALVLQRRPLEAERALRFARQYGNFPTLDYELATALAAAGLYEEAAAELARSFKLSDEQIETRLAGRIPARAASFTELLAPEVRAGLFQTRVADASENASRLKGLLAFQEALGTASEAQLRRAAEAFAEGTDDLRLFRRLYVATRLLGRGLAYDLALEMAERATGDVEAALASPVAHIALLADELRDVRARAIAIGATPELPQLPPLILSNSLRGRIEDAIGWALFNQGKTEEATRRLRRATAVLPEKSTWWRTALWHLGAALEASGSEHEALATYIASYRSGPPDPARRAIIESLYRKLNGTLDGLDDRIGRAPLSPVVNGASSGTISAGERPVNAAPASTATKKELSAEILSSQESSGESGAAPTREATKQIDEKTMRQDTDRQATPSTSSPPTKTAEEQPKADQPANVNEKKGPERKIEGEPSGQKKRRGKFADRQENSTPPK